MNFRLETLTAKIAVGLHPIAIRGPSGETILMKLIRNLLTIATVVGLATGCASTGKDKSARTVKSLAESSSLIEKANGLMGQTLTQLNDLVANPAPDLQKQFAAFNSSLNKLGDVDKAVRRQAEEMKLMSAAYFAKWDEETARMQNEDIRHRSQARKQEVAARFDRISRQYDETKTAFQPFMADLRDVQNFLTTDLTKGGLAAIKIPTAKATSDAIELRASINELDEQFKSFKRSLSTTSGATL